jgi:hypothetical protein
MTKKNTTTKGSTKGKGKGSREAATRRGWLPALEEKAREIIADVDTYDERTREGIKRALKEADERLPDIVKTAEILAAGEPEDKTSDKWRYWKLRSVEADMDSGDEGRRAAAQAYVRRLAAETLATPSEQITKSLLPHLIIECQRRNTAALTDDEGSFEARAHAILTDTERYDYDTRHAVHVALSNVAFNRPEGNAEKYMTAAEAAAEFPRAERELREVVEKAEAGEPVTSSGVAEEYEAAARRVLGLMFSPGTPDFISQGIYDVLHSAEKYFGVKMYKNEITKVADEQGGWSVETMARIFARHPGQTFKLEIQKTLPELLAAAVNHKEMPEELRGTTIQFLGHLQEPDEVTTHPDVLRVAIGAYWRDKEGGKES